MENLTDAPKFSLKNNIYQAKCVKVYDGDTITVIFEFHDTYYKWRVRLARINAPELRGESKQQGIIVRDKLKSLVLNKIITLKCGDFDAFGRILGEVYINDKNINDEMLKLESVVKFE